MIQMKILDKDLYKKYGIPKYATPGSAGIDLRMGYCHHVNIVPGETVDIPTGFAIYIRDKSTAATILPRSGLGKKGLILGNTVGLIDSDYQGELIVSLWNRSNLTHTINPGDRIAQLMFIPIIQPLFELVDEFEESQRGEGGFGSTGVF